MNDELAIIIILAIVAAVLSFFFFFSKLIGGFIFKRLISDSTKKQLTDYYRFKFFPSLIKGAFAGLCVGPLYAIPYYIYLIIVDDMPDFCLGVQILLYVCFFPCFIAIQSIICSMFGMIFEVFSDLLLSVIKKISNSNPDLNINDKSISSEQTSALFVWTLFGTMGVSKLFPDSNILVCLTLSLVLVLGKRIWTRIIEYLASKGIKNFWEKFQKYSSVIVFLISIICVFILCIDGKSIDFALLGDRLLFYSPLLLFFSFYDEIAKFSFIRKIGIFIAEVFLEILHENVKSPSPMAPICIFSSSLSFVLTFVLTQKIMLSFVAIAIAIISVKKKKLEWMYIVFGIVVSFVLLDNYKPVTDSDTKGIQLALAVSVLYALSFSVIAFLKKISPESINIKIH